MGSHWAGQRFLIVANFRIPCSQTPAACDRKPSERVSICPGSPPDLVANPREPGAPTAPDCSPVTRNHLGVTSLRPRGRRVSLSFSQRTGRSL